LLAELFEKDPSEFSKLAFGMRVFLLLILSKSGEFIGTLDQLADKVDSIYSTARGWFNDLIERKVVARTSPSRLVLLEPYLSIAKAPDTLPVDAEAAPEEEDEEKEIFGLGRDITVAIKSGGRNGPL
jgi:hypothetical protein